MNQESAKHDFLPTHDPARAFPQESELAGSHDSRERTAQSGTNDTMNNHEIADCFAEVANSLEAQGANPFRVRAYRTAAENLKGWQQPVGELLEEEGLGGLERLPSIGRSLAHAIEVLLKTGRLPLLDRLRGDARPERIFTTVADVGPELARRIHEHLQIDTLGELEIAANDGRLAQVPGMGPKRVRAVRESLAGRFRSSRAHQPPRLAHDPDREPPLAELLEIDDQYRRLVEQDRLTRIAPRRFNPDGKAWLPILHTQRSERHYTAMFSNSARAHESGNTRDWVVILLDDPHHTLQWTVITAGYGRLRGHRIVRGREDECAAFYAGDQRQAKRRVQFTLF